MANLCLQTRPHGPKVTLNETHADFCAPVRLGTVLRPMLLESLLQSRNPQFPQCFCKLFDNDWLILAFQRLAKPRDVIHEGIYSRSALINAFGRESMSENTLALGAPHDQNLRCALARNVELSLGGHVTRVIDRG